MSIVSVIPQKQKDVDLSGYVANTTTINGKALTDNITLSNTDVGAAPETHEHSNYVANTTTVNGKALDSNITLSASDVSAAAETHDHDLDELSGILSVVNGGTGVTSLDSLASTLASSGGFSKIQTGSYTGTGTYGSSNPNSLTFDFVPTLVMLLGKTDSDNAKVVCSPFIWGSKNVVVVAPAGAVCDVYRNLATTSIANKKMTWYSDESAQVQLNVSDIVYNWVAIG